MSDGLIHNLIVQNQLNVGDQMVSSKGSVIDNSMVIGGYSVVIESKGAFGAFGGIQIISESPLFGDRTTINLNYEQVKALKSFLDQLSVES